MQPVHLCPASNARLDVMTVHVTLYQTLIMIVVLNRMWAWTHYRHASTKYVE
ncbi:hypothetical protein D3C71_1826560 [compost metagenome]